MTRSRATDSPAPFDQDFFEERTDFSWTRSGVALLAAAAVFIRHVLVDEFRAGDVIAFGLLGIAAIGWFIGIVGWRGEHRQSRPSTPRSATELGAVTIGTVSLAVAGLVIMFVN
jgi:uncharacterized membrane protein YidH (DUF202 family)